MTSNLHAVLSSNQLDPGSNRPINVLVELSEKELSDSVSSELEAAGLQIRQVIGSTVVGSIANNRLGGLEDHHSVRGVERSQHLKMHG